MQSDCLRSAIRPLDQQPLHRADVSARAVQHSVCLPELKRASHQAGAVPSFAVRRLGYSHQSARHERGKVAALTPAEERAAAQQDHADDCERQVRLPARLG